MTTLLVLPMMRWRMPASRMQSLQSQGTTPVSSQLPLFWIQTPCSAVFPRDREGLFAAIPRTV